MACGGPHAASDDSCAARRATIGRHWVETAGTGPFIRLLDSMHRSMLPQASAPPLSVLTFPGPSTCLPTTPKYQPHLPTLRTTSSVPLSRPPTPGPAHYVTTWTHSLDRDMERDDTINSQPEYEYEHARTYIFPLLLHSPPHPFTTLLQTSPPVLDPARHRPSQYCAPCTPDLAPDPPDRAHRHWRSGTYSGRHNHSSGPPSGDPEYRQGSLLV